MGPELALKRSDLPSEQLPFFASPDQDKDVAEAPLDGVARLPSTGGDHGAHYGGPAHGIDGRVRSWPLRIRLHQVRRAPRVRDIKPAQPVVSFGLVRTG